MKRIYVRYNLVDGNTLIKEMTNRDEKTIDYVPNAVGYQLFEQEINGNKFGSMTPISPVTYLGTECNITEASSKLSDYKKLVEKMERFHWDRVVKKHGIWEYLGPDDYTFIKEFYTGGTVCSYAYADTEYTADIDDEERYGIQTILAVNPKYFKRLGETMSLEQAKAKVTEYEILSTTMRRNNDETAVRLRVGGWHLLKNGERVR